MCSCEVKVKKASGLLPIGLRSTFQENATLQLRLWNVALHPEEIAAESILRSSSEFVRHAQLMIGIHNIEGRQKARLYCKSI